MYNRVILMGRFTAKPELKTTQNGTSVSTFGLAVNRKYKGDSGGREADFFNIVAWRNTAEFVCKYFKKGDPVHIEGRLQSRSYTDDSGVKRYVTEVIADDVTFTCSKSEAGGNTTTDGAYGSYGTTGYSQPQAADITPGYVKTYQDDEELPF